MKRSHVLTACLSPLLFTACATGPGGYQSERAEGVKLIKTAEAQALTNYESVPLVLPLVGTDGTDLDGTKAALDFLTAAKEKGAEYVSGLEFTLASKDKDCVTHVAPEEEIKSAVVPMTTSGHFESKQVMKPVTRTVTENEYRCQYVSKPVQRTEYQTEYYTEYQYDYASKSNRPVSRSRSVPKTVTRYESQNECHNTPVSRTVTRYEYQYENQYIPPKTEYLTQHFSKWKIAESTPVCQKVTRATTETSRGSVRGKIHIRKR